MLKHKYLLIAALAILSLPAVAEVRIGVINMERVMRESEPAKKASGKLEKEFKKRSQDLDKVRQQAQAIQEDLEKNGTSLSDSARADKSKELADLSRELQRRQREYNEDLNARRNEELQSIVERTNSAIRSMAEKEYFDLIVQEAVYASPRVDITDKVIKALSESAVTK
ncbi:MAG: OmpH family outer membrane protein [Georgfuchsia sp.]